MKKRGFLILAVAMTVAGVASANVFTPAPREPAPRPVALAVPAPAVAKPVVAPVIVAAVPAAPKPSVEVRQAPVPLLMKARPTIDVPAAEAATAAVPAKPDDATADKAGDKAAEVSAKAAIEADGYKAVRVVRQGVNGVWHARALRGTAEVQLTVDAQGRVSTD